MGINERRGVCGCYGISKLLESIFTSCRVKVQFIPFACLKRQPLFMSLCCKRRKTKSLFYSLHSLLYLSTFYILHTYIIFHHTFSSHSPFFFSSFSSPQC
ncbi:hypothetical protein PHAVU_007G174950 [Phaseolus vulgaris]